MQSAPFRSCDLAAFLGAFTARFSTFLAMIGLVFFAFFGAGIADVGTGFAQALQTIMQSRQSLAEFAML